MKKICIIFLTSIIIILSAVGICQPQQTAQTEYLRIHIRANSNSQEDQTVKYKVRDAVVEYLTPYVAASETLAEAEKTVYSQLDGVTAVACKTLINEGFSYRATAAVTTETFPTRVYDGYTLPAGEYRSLILYLGEGVGDNWWCVVYPPLCFSTLSTNVVYKSKIAEIIERWQAGMR
ncbi:MAG: stage II sporulation protein R [Clostridia bacterium]|nr:stage II sporulation protein R [Clostridia bacterium]